MFVDVDTPGFETSQVRDEGAKSTIPLKAYRCHPTFRRGVICEMISPKNLAVMKNVEIQLKEPGYWDSVVKDLKEEFSKFNYEILKGPGETIIEYQEGAIVKFPPFELRLNDKIWLRIRCTNTVCMQPYHSKIWTRVTLDNPRKCPHSLSNFFEISKAISRIIVGILKQKYEAILRSHHLCNNLDTPHNIIIETISENLYEILDKLRSRTFSFSKDFNSATKYDSIKWILATTYYTNYLNYGKYTEMFNAGDNEWVTLNTYGMKNMCALYHKNHSGNETNFKGVVHSNIQDEMDELSRYAGAELIEKFADNI